MLKKTLIVLCAVAVCSSGALAQINVTAPAGQANVKSCNEYSTDVLRDKWDMSQRTDLGWRIYNTVEQPQSNLTNISFAGGIFSAITTSTDPNISILDSHYSGTMATGKVGAAYPIDANKYTVLMMRASFDPDAESTLGIIYWSTNTIYTGVSWSWPVYIFKGWAYYAFDIPTIKTWFKQGDSGDWTGTVGSLRLDPDQKNNKTYQIDWIRLVEKDAALQQTIRWTGNSGNVDIYLDNNATPADGTLGILARNIAGTSYAFLAGGLAAGDYYAVVVATGGNPSGGAASPGYYRINDTPILTFTKPSAEGSNEDFATVTFNDPWDMANLQDIEYTQNQTGGQFTTMSYYDQGGTLFSNRTVYKATSTPTTAPAGDPFINFLYWDGRVRGRNREINADRYHNLVTTFGIEGGFNFFVGSMARVVWKRSAEMAENVSDDIIVRHLNDNSVDWGQTVLNKFVFDLKTLPLETGGGSPSTSGWGGWVDGFRLDPHEFPTAKEFYFDDVKLTADWRADASFPITWSVAHTGGATTVNLYYDTDKNNTNGFGGTIATGLTGTSTTWNCSGVQEGTYWIYATYTDGTNTGQCYAGGPVVVEHHGVPQIRLSRDFINIGAIQSGAITSPAQVLLTNAGTGTLNWSVSIPPENPFLSVSPMSGSGNATLTITVNSSLLGGPGPTYGIITVTDPAALNSPQVIEVWGMIYPSGGSGVPFGDFATPLDNTTGVTGAIPVTGWVLDDIETASVQICRDPVASDPPAAIGANGLVYIGHALFVEGARPDIEVGYPTWPLHYRAGWGYMLLTNFLPAQGCGTFRLHALATDKEGHVVSLGARTIVCSNASAVKPFGTIDDPGAGQSKSGTFFNFGWVLTPQTATVPKDGSTITVYVDSVLLGNLSTPPNVYNAYRVDVSTNFPGLNNSAGPVGAFNLDTTGYMNGVHTIHWIAFDNQGRGDGIGSRYFCISNLGGAPMAADTDVSLPTDRSGVLKIGIVPDRDRAEESGEGFRLKPAPLKRGALEGGPISVEIEELGFVELRFRPESRIRSGSGLRFIGWGDGASKLLPTGSTLDPETGVFSWMPGPGFLGRHVLHFAVSDGEQKSAPLTVAVEIVPKKTVR